MVFVPVPTSCCCCQDRGYAEGTGAGIASASHPPLHRPQGTGAEQAGDTPSCCKPLSLLHPRVLQHRMHGALRAGEKSCLRCPCCRRCLQPTELPPAPKGTRNHSVLDGGS